MLMSSGRRTRANLIETEIIAHCVSGTARQLMGRALVNAEARGLNPVLTVHDEACVEMSPNQEGVLVSCMLDFPAEDWGIPRDIVMCESGSAFRYVK
jgi:hypothetical protein